MEWPKFMVCLQRTKLIDPPIYERLDRSERQVGRNSLGSGPEIIIKPYDVCALR
jgi:hypothetical protein